MIGLSAAQALLRDAIFDGLCAGLYSAEIKPGNKHPKSHADLIDALLKMKDGKTPLHVAMSYQDVVAIFSGDDIGKANAKRFVEMTELLVQIMQLLERVDETLVKSLEDAHDVISEIGEAPASPQVAEIRDVLKALCAKLGGLL